MPVTPTYPGVYIQEIPSGVRTIVGVATSVTAFIGRAYRGPVEKPTTINNFGDYSRMFGGLWKESPMSYAVRDYFLNGGSQAIIVRLYKKKGSETEKAVLDLEGLELEAKNEGTWGNELRGRITISVKKDDAKAFDLHILDENSGVIESYFGVTITDAEPRNVTAVVNAASSLVKVINEPTVVKTNKPTATKGITTDREAWINDNSTAVADGKKGSDGSPLEKDSYAGNEDNKKGIYALEDVDQFNMLCVPPLTMSKDADSKTIGDAMAYCKKRRAFMIVDAPANGVNGWTTKKKAKDGMADPAFGKSDYAAIYFPQLQARDSEQGDRLVNYAPCGAVAGVIARTDTERGIWKAPAGLDATIVGYPKLSIVLSDAENGELNPLGLNCLRANFAGRIIWGARTLRGDDRFASEYKYIPVRRTALHIENSLYRGLQWVVFEPNDEPLWAQIRLNVGAFMQGMFRQGAFEGIKAKDAYFVKCDGETTTATDRNLGIVNILVGFAPLKPAEFVIISLQQMTRKES